ncbi:hypothetical protein GCM10022631_08640 [Deinococcus rubellus]|uniref:Lipocalin-like domain-containing protein n=1 Tax=Deinococcus rubellus TaxID=1889240 RepID=A0ABY5YJE7_9DEIO|nr:hypothetical protein [Deinococcus rubellus]UWX64212.1 hypothetical protein N0D28_00605 [Deinococcus rubellus]
MRNTFGLALLTLTLSACTTTTYIPEKAVLTVPSDPHILQGQWAGIGFAVRPVRGPDEAIQLTANASYETPTSYTFTGSLVFRGETYALSGTATGEYNVTLKPQMSLPPPPTIVWEGKLQQNGVDVGTISGSNSSLNFSRNTQTGGLSLTVWGPHTPIVFTLDRVASAVE